MLPPMNVSLRRHGYNVSHAHIYEKHSDMGPTQTLHPIGYTALGPNLINKFKIWHSNIHYGMCLLVQRLHIARHKVAVYIVVNITWSNVANCSLYNH